MAFSCVTPAWLLLCCVALSSCLPHPLLPHPLRSKRNAGRLCGKMLVDVLALVCGNNYYDPNGPPSASQIRKRTNYQYVPDPGYVVLDPSLTEFEGFMDPQTALDFLGANQMTPRQQRGIADECCSKPCNMSVLMSYCAPGSRK